MPTLYHTSSSEPPFPLLSTHAPPPFSLKSTHRAEKVTSGRRMADHPISACRQEVSPQKALLRTQCYHQHAPHASGGVAAAHLVNYALHRVTQRLKNHKDPRMASLKSVNNLLSLQTGDKQAYKWGSRQPMRRRRGDVHDDLTAAVFHLDWEGMLRCPRGMFHPCYIRRKSPPPPSPSFPTIFNSLWAKHSITANSPGYSTTRQSGG